MEVTSYAPGTPSWVDVSSTNLSATVEFLRELFGWTAVDMGEESGHYTMFDVDGKHVAAASPKAPGDTSPSAWTTYITVADVDATAAAARESGGSVLMDPMDVFDAGRMALLADPSGGVFAIWQAGRTIGAQLVNEPNTLCWNELNVRDPDRVLPFYVGLFGWNVVEQEVDGRVVYRELCLGDRRVAGCIQMDEKWPASMPTHWMTYFAVADCDRAAERARALGGIVHVEPNDIPAGRFSLVQEPGGAVFAVIQLATTI